MSIDNAFHRNTWAGAEPTIVIEPHKGLFHIDVRSLWEYRELLYFLVWRDLKVRYKQTAIGACWAIIQPLVSMVIFTIILGHFARVPSGGLPYPVLVYSGLLPWNYFASAFNRSVQSIVGDAHLISKIYFPRLILPLAGTLSGLVDFLISSVLLLAMMLWYDMLPTWELLALPIFLLLSLVTALAVGLWLSALNVRYRDVGHVIPFVTQAWMFATPVVYPVSLIPEKWRLLYSLNPMVGVIEGFRWAFLGEVGLDVWVMGVSFAMVLIILAAGLIFFGNMEQTFADVV